MGDFVVARWDLQPYPGDQAPVHVHHASDEAFCILDGRLEVLIGAERRVLERGEHVVVPAGTPHTFATVDDTPVSMLAVMTPEVAALVAALHDQAPGEDPHLIWSRHRSAVV